MGSNVAFREFCKPFYNLLEAKQVMDFDPTDYMVGNELQIPALKLSSIRREVNIIEHLYKLLDMLNFLSIEKNIVFDCAGLIRLSKSTLIDKAKEYSIEEKRLSNFDTAIKYMPIGIKKTSESIMCISAKHFAWIEDAINDIVPVTESKLTEHGQDCLNYILLYGFALQIEGTSFYECYSGSVDDIRYTSTLRNSEVPVER